MSGHKGPRRPALGRGLARRKLSTTPTTIHVVLHTPLLTGARLTQGAAEATTAAELDELAAQLNQPLQVEHARISWERPSPLELGVPGDPAHRGGDIGLQQYSQELNAGLRRFLPHRLVGQNLLPNIQRPGPALLPFVRPRDADWKLEAASVDIWNSGVALFATRYRVLAERLRWTDLMCDVDHVRDEVNRQAAPFLREIVASFQRAATRCGAALGNTDGEAHTVSGLGEPLWTHNSLLVFTHEDATDEELGAIASRLTNGGPSYPLGEQLDSGAKLRLGLNACLCCRPVGQRGSGPLIRLVAAHTALWAAATDFDRALLRELAAGQLEDSTSLGTMEDRAGELLRVYQRLQGFQSALRNTTVHLDDVDRLIWTALSTQWGLPSQLDALGHKLESLDHIYGQLTSALTARRARRLDGFLSVFTVASVVTTGLAVASFIFRPLGEAMTINIAIAVALLVATFALWCVLRYFLGASRIKSLAPGRPSQGGPSVPEPLETQRATPAERAP